jgi:hypothetical protein
VGVGDGVTVGVMVGAAYVMILYSVDPSDEESDDEVLLSLPDSDGNGVGSSVVIVLLLSIMIVVLFPAYVSLRIVPLGACMVMCNIPFMLSACDTASVAPLASRTSAPTMKPVTNF